MARQLTASQKKFAEEFVMNDGSKTKEECALSAGYSKSSARVRASELTNPQKYPEVCKYIEELQTQVNQKYNVTFGRHVKKLAEIRDAALEKGNYTAAVAAETQRGRAAGLYVERKEVRTGSLESLSEVELKKKMRELVLDYKPMLEIENAPLVAPPSSDILDP